MATPTISVQTGKGVHFYWLFDRPLHKQALPRWQACMAKLHEVLMPFGVDEKVKDCARVLRLVGSVNSTAKFQDDEGNAIPWVVRAEVLQPNRHNFEDLATRLLPYSREEVKLFIWNKEQRGAKRTKTENLRFAGVSTNERGNVTQLKKRNHVGFASTALARLSDLSIIAKAKYPDGVENGERDKFLFHATCNLAWICNSKNFEFEINKWRATYTPSVTSQEMTSQMMSAVRRAKLSYKALASGVVMLTHDDHRYAYSRKALWKEFGEDITALGLLSQMKAMVPDELASDRAAAKRKSDRQAKQETTYTGTGLKSCNVAKALRARTLYGDGQKMAEIASLLKVSIKTISLWIKLPDGVFESPCSSTATLPKEPIPAPVQVQPTPALIPANSAMPAVCSSSPVPQNLPKCAPTSCGEADLDVPLPSNDPDPEFQSLEKTTGRVLNIFAKVKTLSARNYERKGGPDSAPSATQKQKSTKNSDLEVLRRMDATDAIKATGLYFKIDQSYSPSKDKNSVRLHVTSITGQVHEIVCTKHKWFIAAQGIGADSAIDLVMQLMDVGFTKAIDQLRKTN
jgi:hypothetical protein